MLSYLRTMLNITCYMLLLIHCVYGRIANNSDGHKRRMVVVVKNGDYHTLPSPVEKKVSLNISRRKLTYWRTRYDSSESALIRFLTDWEKANTTSANGLLSFEICIARNASDSWLAATF